MAVYVFRGSREYALKIRGWGTINTLDSIPKIPWRPVFRAWAQLQFDYWQRTGGDVGWWNSERASVSLLAAAVWRSGNNAALQEYGDEKFLKGIRYSGRPDMYVALGDSEFVIEAKQCWLNLPGRGAARQHMHNSFAAAIADANRVKADWIPRIAVCFAVPRVSPSHVADSESLVADFCDETDFSSFVSSGYRVDLYPLNVWTNFGPKACGWPVDAIRRHYVGCSLLLGFLD